VPNVAEIIRDHVTLQLRCVDRLYLNGYCPALQSGGGGVAFLRRVCGQAIPSPVGLGTVTEGFKHTLRDLAERQGIPWIEFRKGERKDDVVERYRRRFTKRSGMVLIGVAQERASAWRGSRQQEGRRVHFDFRRAAVYVNHYYIYVLDEEWGPAFIKVCGYAPYGLKICLNGHEWVKRQLARRRIPFTALDNGFFACAKPEALQSIADALNAEAIQQFLTRWEARLPLPLSAMARAAGFSYRLSILQMEVSLTQVFDAPRRGRELFEEIIREHLALGRPDHLALVFPRRFGRYTKSRWRTHVVTTGVRPSLHVEYKHCRVKQYFKEERALRTETTFNDTYDLGVNRGLSNFSYLRTLGDHINQRVLTLEELAHDCQLAPPQLDRVIQPTRTDDGQRAPALKWGDPRVMALLAALCQFGWAVNGLRHRDLRPLMQRLFQEDYTARQMSYDLRRLARKGIIARLEGQHAYMLTPFGRRIALFLTKVHERVVRPGFQGLNLSITSQAPPPLRTAFAAVDRAIDTLAKEARLAV